MLVFDMKDKDGNLTHKFSMDIKELKQGVVAYSKEEGYLKLENFTN